MRTKAQGLLGGAKWIEGQYGRDALADVVRACSPAVRERIRSGIAINWIPAEEVIEFAEVADRVLGNGSGKFAELIGEAGARGTLRGPVLRLVFYLGNPGFLLRRVTQIWGQFNDDGALHLRRFDERSAVIELTGIAAPHAIYCGLLTGWIREIAKSMGARNAIVRHVDCCARACERCVWEVRWIEVDP